MKSVAVLQRLALSAVPSRLWYAAATLAIDRSGYPADTFAAMLALTSPRQSVRRNWTLAERAMRGDYTGMLPSVRAGVEHYRVTGVIRGPKTREFYRALRGHGDAIPLDVWMARALGVPPDTVRLAGVRRKAQERIRRVADSLGWQPREVQAAIWAATIQRHGKKVPIMGQT